MEILLAIAQGYLAVGLILGILSIFVSTSSGFKEFLKEEYPDEEWGWRNDLQVTLEVVFLWPLILFNTIRR